MYPQASHLSLYVQSFALQRKVVLLLAHHCAFAIMQGAQNVRCARCGHITAVPPAGGSSFLPKPLFQLLKTASQSCAIALSDPAV